MSGLEPLLAAAAVGAGETAAVGAAAGTAAAASAAPTLSLGSLGSVAGIGGSVLSGVGSIVNANSQADAARAEAAQLERAAGEAQAAAQRNAERKRKEAQLIMSRQQALAAKSGGGATDSTVLDLMAGAKGEGELQGRMLQYEGDERAAGLTYQAAIKRAMADRAQTAGWIGAGASVLSGLNSWNRYRKFGMDPTDPLSLDYRAYRT